MFKFFNADHCVNAQCDADAAAAQQISDAAANAAEQVADYMRLINAPPKTPPPPSGARPEQRLRTYHPIPQASSGAVIVINGLPCGADRIGYAVYAAAHGAFTATDVTDALQIVNRAQDWRRLDNSVVTATNANSTINISIPASYTLPAAARAVLGDDLDTAIRGAAAVYTAAHDYVAALADRQRRADRYGSPVPAPGPVPGVYLNAPPDMVAKGAPALTDTERRSLDHWTRIQRADGWLETVDAFKARQSAWDTAQAAHRDGQAAYRRWLASVRDHPVRRMVTFKI